MTTISFQPYAPGRTDNEGQRLGSIDPRLSRTNYFDGQLLKAADLSRDQRYLDERLLEMGQVLGRGIAQGLEVELVENHLLRVQPGIAIAPSGRVLQLSGKTLEINLQDSGFIADLNLGRYRRFNRGLYAIALKYAEVVDGVSEAYPADLKSRRAWQVSSYSEGVELALVPMNINLPLGDGIAIRAALFQEVVAGSSRFTLPTDEAVTLGLIAIDQGRPLWLDRGLLRRPLRPANCTNALSLDLACHYRELFQEVLSARLCGGRRHDFAASTYFRLLPPWGPLAKEAIDPVTGRQSYFPKGYEVSIAPVRRADLQAIIAESAQLAPMDLERDADADIMVLVPMSDQEFALCARQLENSSSPTLAGTAINKLPWFNALALRLFTQPPVHRIDTDADTWKAIWAKADPAELIFVRRPPRAAETNVSAVVLARGFELPPVADGLPLDPASLERQLDQALERAVGAEAGRERLAKAEAGLKGQIEKLQQALGGDTTLAEALAQSRKLEGELAAAQAEITALKSGEQNAVILAAARDKINALSTELDLAYQRLASLPGGGPPSDEAAQRKIKELATALAANNSQMTVMQQERDDARTRQAETELQLKTLNAELEPLRRKLEELQSGVATGGVDLAAAKEEVAKLNQQIETAALQQEGLRAEILQSQQALAKAENDSKSAMLKLTDAMKLTQDAQAESNTRAVELNKGKESIASLQSQLQSAEQKSVELQNLLSQRISLRSTLPLAELATMRGYDPAAAEKLEAQVGDNNSARLAVVHLLMLSEARLDPALWPSLSSVAQEPKNLVVLRDALVKSIKQGEGVATAFPRLSSELKLGLSAADIKAWKSLVG